MASEHNPAVPLAANDTAATPHRVPVPDDFIARKLREQQRERANLRLHRWITRKTYRTAQSTLVTAQQTIPLLNSVQGLTWETRAAVTRVLCLLKVTLLALLLSTAGIVLVLASLRHHLVRIDVALETLNRPAAPVSKAVLNIGQWRSGVFDVGSARCTAYRGFPNPCPSWHFLGHSLSSAMTPAQVAAAQQDAQLLLIVTGGHDGRRVRGSLAQQVGGNAQLAQLRADAVYDTFARELEQRLNENGTPQDHWPQVQPVLTTRGARDIASPADQDRTVTLTLIRVDQLPGTLP
jgi:hypothetical protein